MSPRYTATHAQSPLHAKAGRLARKHWHLSSIAATAVAAAAIGAVASSAGATPWTAALDSLNTAGHSQQVSTADHAKVMSVFDSVLGGGVQHSQAATGGQAQRTTGGAQLDAYEVPGVGFVGSLVNHPASAPANNSPVRALVNLPKAMAAAVTAPHAASAPAAHTQAAHTVAVRPAPAKPAPAHAAPAHAAPAHAAPAHAAPVRHVAPTPPPQPYTIYDSVTPTSIPAHQAVATYANGAYAASPSSVAGRGHVLWIDTNGSDPQANALDVEPGDATPTGAALWVKAHEEANPKSVAIVYTMLSDWQQVKDNVAGLPNWMQSHVRYWIADPTGVPHVVPGSNATQWYWGNNYDITTANPGFQG